MLLNVFWCNVVTNFNCHFMTNNHILIDRNFDLSLKLLLNHDPEARTSKSSIKCSISPGLMDSVEPSILPFFSQDLWHWHFQEVTKKTELSERQVLRWLRRRGKQDSPSTMQKFTECRSVLHILKPSLSNLKSSPSNLKSSHKS